MLNNQSSSVFDKGVNIFGTKVKVRTVCYILAVVFCIVFYGVYVFLCNMGKRNLMKTNPRAYSNIMTLLPSIYDRIVDVIWKKNGGLFTWFWSGVGADAFLVLEQVANVNSAEQLTEVLANVVKEQKEQERYEREMALKRTRIEQEERKIALKTEQMGTHKSPTTHRK